MSSVKPTQDIKEKALIYSQIVKYAGLLCELPQFKDIVVYKPVIYGEDIEKLKLRLRREYKFVDEKGRLLEWVGWNETYKFIHIVFRKPEMFDVGKAKAWYVYVRVRKDALDKIMKEIVKRWGT